VEERAVARAAEEKAEAGELPVAAPVEAKEAAQVVELQAAEAAAPEERVPTGITTTILMPSRARFSLNCPLP